MEIQIPLLLSYSLVYQGDASPLKGSSHPWMEWCVLILTPSPSIYRPSYRRENILGTWEFTVGPITEHHVEANCDPWRAVLSPSD
jgi:hypothetical protein